VQLADACRSQSRQPQHLEEPLRRLLAKPVAKLGIAGRQQVLDDRAGAVVEAAHARQPAARRQGGEVDALQSRDRACRPPEAGGVWSPVQLEERRDLVQHVCHRAGFHRGNIAAIRRFPWCVPRGYCS